MFISPGRWLFVTCSPRSQVKCRLCAMTGGDVNSVAEGVSKKMAFTHHQKYIICDVPKEDGTGRELHAFVGGVDLTEGRWDNRRVRAMLFIGAIASVGSRPLDAGEEVFVCSILDTGVLTIVGVLTGAIYDFGPVLGFHHRLRSSDPSRASTRATITQSASTLPRSADPASLGTTSTVPSAVPRQSTWRRPSRSAGRSNATRPTLSTATVLALTARKPSKTRAAGARSSRAPLTPGWTNSIPLHK